MEEMEELNEFDVDEMNDEELQEAFAAGVLKPGLNVPVERKEFANNVKGLLRKLEEFQLDLPWVERLDLIVEPAPMAPELQYELKKTEDNIPKLKSRMKRSEIKRDKEILDDFKRETLFHRQAQTGLMRGIKKLNKLGIKTERPEDYFAEMVKTDEHMQKVRKNLAARQESAVKSARIAELRRQKKMAKQTQTAAKLKQIEEKRKMLHEIQNYRKGVRKDLDFLEKDPNLNKNKPSKKKKKNQLSEKKKKKEAFKLNKYGYGGKKRGSKKNTRESFSDIRQPTRKGKPVKRKRIGKNKRLKLKSKI